MRVNRLGKCIIEKGFTFKDFIKEYNLSISFNTLYGWCTKYVSTPNLNNYKNVDDVAKALGVGRTSVLDMIATKAVFDVDYPKKQGESEENKRKFRSQSGDNLLKQKRIALGLTQGDLAKVVGVEQQYIADIENGKRNAFPDSKILTNYLNTLGLSFGELQREIASIKAKKKSASVKPPVAPVEEVKEELPVEVVTEVKEEVPAPFTTVKVNLADVADKVLECIYGEVDYKTYKYVEELLKR